MVKVEEAIYKMRVLDRKYRHSCHQITLLNRQIKDKKIRYNRVHKNNRKSWYSTLRLQLATLEGVRNMFYEYAYRRAEEMEALQDVLVEEGILSDTEEELVWDEE